MEVCSVTAGLPPARMAISLSLVGETSTVLSPSSASGVAGIGASSTASFSAVAIAVGIFSPVAGHSLSIAGTGKIAIECFHGAVACDAAAGLTGGNRPDDLAGEAAVFTEAVVVHGTAQGHTDTAGLPTDGACRTLLHMAAHHAGKPACKGIAGCDFCGGC